MNRRTRFLLMGFTGACLWGTALHAEWTIQLKTPTGSSEVTAEEKDEKIWVDVVEVANGLKGDVYLRSNTYVMEFSSFTLAVNPEDSTYKVRLKGKKKWRNSRLEDPVYVRGNHVMVSLESLPTLFHQTFTYHRQKRVLELDQAANQASKSDYRLVPVRNVRMNQKVWISVEDLAKALGVVVYSSQANRYNLVMPDFAILQLRVGESWVYKRNDPYKLLEEPVLLFSGSPYITLNAIQPIFGIDAQWDRTRQALLLPNLYGRLREIQPAEQKPLKFVGYEPEPFRMKIEEISAYYQFPGPSYGAEHDQVYESVRDFLSNDPLRPDTKGFQRVSGQGLASFRGSLLGAPMEGRGEFEKIGTTGRVNSGSAQWGFAWLQLKGGREYVRFGGLANQFEPFNQVSLSHSNDHYGENETNPEWSVKTLYGQNQFSIFMSTALFSQTVNFQQDMAAGSLQWDWEITDQQRLGVNVGQHLFKNRIRGIASDSYEDDFLADPGEIILTVDSQDEKALAATILGEHHATTLVDVSYKIEKTLQLSGTAGLSYYRDSVDHSKVYDHDWRLRSVVGGTGSRLDVSYEKVGPHYRSIGSPLRYQDRWIFRASPYLDILKAWKMYGEVRRENVDILVRQGGRSYRNDYLALGQLFNFRKFAVRTYTTKYDSSLYGKRWSSSLDHTQYLGRDSADLGVAWSSQWTSTRLLYKQSYTGKASYQILRPSWRFSVGQELTRHHYKFYNLDRWESVSNALVQWKGFKGYMQYAFEPKYFREDENLYTGYARLGHQVGKRKIVNFFYATTSAAQELGHPKVWRTGIEYVDDF